MKNMGNENSLLKALLSARLISQDQLRIAEIEARRKQHPISEQLVELGFLSAECLIEMRASQSGHQRISLGSAMIDPAVLQSVPREFARHHRLLPLGFEPEKQTIRIAMAAPDDLPTLDSLQALLGKSLRLNIFLADAAEIEQAIDRYYGHELSIDGILHELEPGGSGKNGQIQASTAKDEFRQPIVRLVEALLVDAIKREASDIHFEPEHAFLRIRYRIDGLLQPIRIIPLRIWPAMVVRLKVLAGMNIAEMRAPQDGRISLQVSGRAIDLRVASHPTLHGENMVLRILDRQRGLVALDQLGLEEQALAQLRRMLRRPSGIILVTGPTGSGKTSTLYSLLREISHEGINVMTLEDPVEYPLPLIRQTSLSDAVKLDFADGIRSLMRQDPDVILVGEIRDAASASMAFEAAMTGHQVYSTLHTNSAAGALPRLLDLGIRPDILAGNMIGIVAQRLLRRLCPRCRKQYPASPEEQKLIARTAEATFSLFHATGCEHCRFSGFHGRLAIMEVLRIDSAIDDLLAKGAGQSEILASARLRGFRSLAEAGLAHVRSGETSLAELVRVVDFSDRI